MKKLKMAVVGVGAIGGIHARIVKELDNTELTAIVDINEELAKNTAESLECEYYTSVDELLINTDVDALDICVPDAYHLEPCILAANAKKHILLEKPIARTVKKSEEIRKICSDNDVKLMIAHTCRFSDKYRKLQEVISQGQIGEVSEISIRRYTSKSIIDFLKGRTSILYYIGVHDIDAVQWYTGSKIVKVYAQKTQKISPYSEDSIVFMFELENGAVGTFHLGWNMPDSYGFDICKINVIGTKSAAFMDMSQTGFQVYTEDVKQELDTAVLTEIGGKMKGIYNEEIRHFADGVLNNIEFQMPTTDAIDAIKVIEGILESIEKGMPVKICR